MIVSFIFKISCFLGIKQAKKIKPGWEFLGTDWENYDLKCGRGARTKKLKVFLFVSHITGLVTVNF